MPGQGWLYLCAVRDGCSRRVIGYAFSDSLHTDVVASALRRAVTFRDDDTTGVIFHADRGCQYTSTQLATVADDLGVRLSVGRTGVCFDNAQQESFWSSLKTEFYNRHTFHHPGRGDPRRDVLDRDRLQPPPTPLRPQHDQSSSVRTPTHHRGTSRIDDVHETGSTPYR